MTPNIAERVEKIKVEAVWNTDANESGSYRSACDDDVLFLIELLSKYQKLVERADSLYSELAIMELNPEVLTKWIEAREESGLFDSP